MQIFGSDGFRCKFGENFMTPNFICDFANAVGDFCINNELLNPILIARDTRASGLIIEDLLSGVLHFKGIKVVLCGVIPTPGLSVAMELGEYSLGIMITASHNPYSDNGIKLFNAAGFKLNQSDDAQIENAILNPEKLCFAGHYGFEYKSEIDACKIYSDSVSASFNEININSSVLVDCSNGACSEVAQACLAGYENVHFINSEPNGLNINLDCGALESQKLLSLVRKGGYNYGVAFDGDGDRSVFVSADYGVIESEKLLYLFYQVLKSPNKTNVVVATEICNLGLTHNFKAAGVELVQTEVGDRFVTEKVRATNAIIGGEPSGHYYFPLVSRSMDGLIGLMHFFQVLESYTDELTNTLNGLKHYDRVTRDINIKDKGPIDLIKLRKKMFLEINSAEEKLVIRQSMWDPVLRVYYDYMHTSRFSEVEKLLNEHLSA